ncbi:MAG: DUF6067 family protein, partial [Armatimonadetes bacterium]|nr:DUF6067 family protein [Armatimonadota bacterium]
MSSRRAGWARPGIRNGRAWSAFGTVLVLFGAGLGAGNSPAARANQPTTKDTPSLSDEALAKVIHERALWENNTLGVTDKIPPPWRAMVVRGRAVECWGRTYDYEGSLLPRQVTSQDAEILAAPIVLAARVGQREVEFRQAFDQKLSAAPNQVDIDATAMAGGLRLQARSHIEYDGCVRVELSVSPVDKPVLLEGLELRIPVRPERALYYHWFEATRDPKLTNAGALPKTGLRSHFKPLLWLGDDDRGFCWFCEAPRDWQISSKESLFEVRREGQAVVMVVRMMDRPYVIARPWRVVFGLMATPVRPMPPGWRDWLIPLNITNPWSAWHTGFFNNAGGTDDPGTRYPLDPQAIRDAVQRWQRRGQPVPLLPMREPMRVMPYSQIVFWSGKHRDGTPSPEIKIFGPEWSNRNQPPGPRREADADIPLNEYYWVCPASSFAQFYIYRF